MSRRAVGVSGTCRASEVTIQSQPYFEKRSRNKPYVVRRWVRGHLRATGHASVQVARKEISNLEKAKARGEDFDLRSGLPVSQAPEPPAVAPETLLTKS